MKRLLTAAAAAAIALTGLAGTASAQPYGHAYGHDHDRYDRGHHHRYVRHDDWRRGHRMPREYWARGERVDWRYHHLRRPPRGYEWREVDGNYVLAAIATGLIAAIIANSR